MPAILLWTVSNPRFVTIAGSGKGNSVEIILTLLHGARRLIVILAWTWLMYVICIGAWGMIILPKEIAWSPLSHPYFVSMLFCFFVLIFVSDKSKP